MFGKPELVLTVLVRMPNESQPELWYRAVQLISGELERCAHQTKADLIPSDAVGG